MSIKILKEDLTQIIDEELARAISNRGNFTGKHGAYAVILEEVEEAKEELDIVEDALKCLWHCIRHKIGTTGEIETIVNRALNGAAELIQVAAMAKKFQQYLGAKELHWEKPAGSAGEMESH